MARITVEDCIDKFDSRFELVLVASNRARKLHSGEEPTVEKDNDKNTVIALREIADETISSEEFKQSLIEEHQSVSTIDEEDHDIEPSEYNMDDEEPQLENKTTYSIENEVNSTSADHEENISETEDGLSDDIKDIETDKSV